MLLIVVYFYVLCRKIYPAAFSAPFFGISPSSEVSTKSNQAYTDGSTKNPTTYQRFLKKPI